MSQERPDDPPRGIDDPSRGIDDERRLLDDPSRASHSGVVDARGLRCPAPIILLARAARDAAPGSVLEVRWTDPAAETDIGAWARMRGHRVLGTEPLAGLGGEAGDPPAYATAGEPPTRDTAGEPPAYATRVLLTPP